LLHADAANVAGAAGNENFHAPVGLFERAPDTQGEAECSVLSAQLSDFPSGRGIVSDESDTSDQSDSPFAKQLSQGAF
jgi:hypothetical protein